MGMDTKLVLKVELGRTQLAIESILALSQGSIIELDKVAGELLEVRVGGKVVARGEAVVVNDKFGVRLTEMVGKEKPSL